jgi:hypothetical protein
MPTQVACSPVSGRMSSTARHAVLLNGAAVVGHVVLQRVRDLRSPVCGLNVQLRLSTDIYSAHHEQLMRGAVRGGTGSIKSNLT